MAHLPHTGRWQLVDPRITAGLLGGEKPPFGILEVDFASLQGTARWWRYRTALATVAIDHRSHDTFSARYALRGNSGAFRAKLRDSGDLDMHFYEGPPVLKCRAVRRGSTAWRPKCMAVLTCVGNPGWPTGPGHSALVADHCVYTFERVNAKVSTSGWKVMMTSTYLNLPENLARPLIIQELDPAKVDFMKIWEYVDHSTRDDEDFISSGWCSMQNAAALAVGVPGGFEPKGVDTPRRVHELASSRKLVTTTYRIWNPSMAPAKDAAALNSELAKYYPGVGDPTGRDVRDW